LSADLGFTAILFFFFFLTLSANHTALSWSFFAAGIFVPNETFRQIKSKFQLSHFTSRSTSRVVFLSLNTKYLKACLIWGNIIRTAPCWIVWHNVHSLQHKYMSSSYRSNKLNLSLWDRYAVC